MSDAGKPYNIVVRASPRIYFGDRFVASEGRIRLLELVDQCGSLQSAASEMGMSYRHAWGMIKRAEEAAGKPLISSKRGGTSGGKSTLTPAARDLVKLFRQKEKDLVKLSKYGASPSLAVDVVVLCEKEVLLIKRGREPYKGMLALPGGFVDAGETVEQAAVREVKEETGLDIVLQGIVGVFSDPLRDPRGHTVSIAFLAEVAGGELQGGDDAASALFMPLDDVKELAFDHRDILDSVLLQ